ATESISISNVQLPIIALYGAIGSELDVSILRDALIKQGVKVVLPVVVKKHAPLVFRQWQIGCEMSKDLFDILTPSAANPELVPNIILLHLLAFDEDGGRLGYGGGFYDRTLGQLGDQVITIGVGFAGQKIQKVPMGLHDKRVDYILTENELLKIE
ncbi:MAG: 5-formyltetrahydrofolate cyclo-ligase, partial [Rhizobiales bacterium]|nr:5-formyltetrahydrofolate cyclo-ligase [Hyphomicrobiales bacterium]